MRKKIFLAILMATAALTASAQYKVTSVERSYFQGFEISYALETEQTTVLYGTLTSDEDSLTLCLNRKAAVYQNGKKYAVKNSINLPVWDDADRMVVYLPKVGSKVNFIIECDKFNPAEPFDFLEHVEPEGVHVFCLWGIKTEPVELEKFPDFDTFHTYYPVTLSGSYKDNGANVAFIIHNDLYVTCRLTTYNNGIFDSNYFDFVVEINNNTDHGVTFDHGEVYAVLQRNVRGKMEQKYATKYSASSYDEYMASKDYEEAKRAVGAMKDVGNKLKSESYKYNNSDWAKLGFSVLSSLANNAGEQSIQNYLAAHPKRRLGGLQSQSLKSGDAVSGHLTFKLQKHDHIILHIPMDGYDFWFKWNN